MPTAASDAVVAHFEQVIAEEEVRRASRFCFDHLRNSFVITHGVLRCLLGRYLNRDPSRICFIYGDKGKPGIDSDANLEFNLTHSEDMAAIAFTAGCQLGIDVEHIRPLADLQQIADRYFSPEEAAELILLPANEREQGFFRCWTRKEAYIKAVGDGLSCALDSFRVTLLPDALPRLIHIAEDRVAADMWTLHDLRLAPDYAAAVAYPDRQRSLSIFPILDFSDLFDI
jgi:4'-phosphopantetheinyl transferase